MRPSDYLKFKDEVVRRGFDAAAHWRLKTHLNLEKLDYFKGINLAALAAMAGEILKFDGES